MTRCLGAMATIWIVFELGGGNDVIGGFKPRGNSDEVELSRLWHRR